MTDYDFELDRIVDEIRKSDAKIVGLQFPDGLKSKAVEVAREIEKRTGCTTVIFADPCYGACDTKEAEAEKLGIDMVFQFGHDQF
jgi:2-(3-amino-3-carboxypropyl)histidine synthase